MEKLHIKSALMENCYPLSLITRHMKTKKNLFRNKTNQGTEVPTIVLPDIKSLSEGIKRIFNETGIRVVSNHTRH